MKLAIIIPAYNEEKRIGKTLEGYTNYFEKVRKKEKLQYELIVVINNTQDKTLQVVKKAIKKNKRIRYLNLVLGGKGYATIQGFKEALKGNSALISFVDADMASPPEALHRLIKELNAYDGTIASRYLLGAQINPPQPLSRIFISRVFNFIVRSLFFLPYRDTQCGAKLFRRKAIEQLLPHLTISQWAFDIELLYWAKKLHLNIKEIPTLWGDKEESHIDIKKSSSQMLFAVTQLRIKNSSLRRIFLPVNNLIERLWRSLL